MERTTVGIDLGTTYSLVACLGGGEPKVIPNRLGEYLTPSVVGLDDQGQVLVGAPAAARRITHPHLTASLFKRSMGTNDEYFLGSKRFRPEELSGLILRNLREDAERYLGRPIDEAVVTVPAYFGEMQRTATKDACAIAQLHVERIINEPTAAALAFGLANQHRELRAIVLDLGGGTFDVSVLEILEGVVEIQATAGDICLGGEDFTSALFEELCSRFEQADQGTQTLPPQTRERLRRAAENAKKTLSKVETASVSLTNLGTNQGSRVSLDAEIGRAEAEALWQPLFERMKGPIFRALRDANVAAESIDEVLLVGGATRTPSVRQLAQQIFGPREFLELPPDEAVVLGAAVQAALKANSSAIQDMIVTDVAPFSLGISTSRRVGATYVSGNFLPIIERGTVLPASRVKQVHPLEEDQRMIRLEIFQGEHFDVSKNQKLAKFEVNVPPGGDKVSVDVRFTYDLNGLLEVDTEVVSTGKKQNFVLEKAGSNMSKADLAAARKRMQALKFHPREALPNVTALARAESLYVELRGDLRELLGDRISAFKSALETQDPTRIEEQRNALRELTLDLSG